MKLFVIHESRTEYDDNFYEIGGPAEPVKAYREKGRADEECDRMNLARLRSGEFPIDPEDRDPENIPEYFTVVERDVPEDQIVGGSPLVPQDALTYSERRAAAKKAAEEAAALAKDELMRAFLDVFQKHPVVKAVQWQQYTPHFNDGDECVFSVNEAAARFDGHDDFRYSYESRDVVAHTNAWKAIEKAMEAIDEDDFRNVFGDHVEITATLAGFEVDSYSHD